MANAIFTRFFMISYFLLLNLDFAIPNMSNYQLSQQNLVALDESTKPEPPLYLQSHVEQPIDGSTGHLEADTNLVKLAPSDKHADNQSHTLALDPSMTSFQLSQQAMQQLQLDPTSLHSYEAASAQPSPAELGSHAELPLTPPVEETYAVTDPVQKGEPLNAVNLPDDNVLAQENKTKKFGEEVSKAETLVTHLVKKFGAQKVLGLVNKAISKVSSPAVSDQFQLPAHYFDQDMDIAAIRTSFYYSTTKKNVVACGLPDTCPVHGHVVWAQDTFKLFNWELCTHLFVPATVDEDRKIMVAEHMSNLIVEAKKMSKDLKVIISLSFTDQLEEWLIKATTGDKNKCVKNWATWLVENELLGEKKLGQTAKNTTLLLDGFQIPLYPEQLAIKGETHTELLETFNRELGGMERKSLNSKRVVRRNYQLFAKLVFDDRFEKMGPISKDVVEHMDYFYVDTTLLFPYSYEHNEKNLISVVEKLKRNRIPAGKIVLGLPLKAIELKAKLKDGEHTATSENLLNMLALLDKFPLKDIVVSEKGHEKTIHYAAYNELHTEEYHPCIKVDVANNLIFLGNSREELERKIHFIILRGLGGAFLNVEYANDADFPIFYEGFKEITGIIHKRFFGKMIEPTSEKFVVQEPNDWLTDKSTSEACYSTFNSPKQINSNNKCEIFAVKMTDVSTKNQNGLLQKLGKYLPQKKGMSTKEVAQEFLKQKMPQIIKTQLDSNKAKTMVSVLEKVGAVCVIV